MSRPDTPPALATAILARVLSGEPIGESLLGDLHEEWAVRAARRHELAAPWYWVQALRLAMRYVIVRPEADRRRVRGTSDGILLRTSLSVRLAARTLRRHPGYSGVAVITLALGLGATSAVFSFADGVLVKPLAYEEPERLVMVWEANQEGDRGIPSPPLFTEWRAHNRVFSHMAAVTSYGGGLNLFHGNRAERVRGRFVSASFFEMIGTRAALGRTFTEGEDQIGYQHVAVLTHRFWRSRFAADPAIIGRTLSLNDVNYTVIGVLPRRAVFERDVPDLWLPLAFSPEQMRPSNQFFSVMARLRDGVSPAQAEADMRRVATAMDEAGRTYHRGWTVDLQPCRDYVISGDLQEALRLLMGAALFLLLIACTNTAGMQLAFGAAREHQNAIRSALGATRWRLMQEPLVESVLLALFGGAAGLMLGVGLSRAATGLMPRLALPNEVGVAMDWRVFAFTFAACLVTGVVFGMIPAWHAGRAGSAGPDRLRAAGGRHGGRGRSQSLLLVTEIALTCTLVMGAGLLVRGFARILGTDPGFGTDGVLTWQTDLDPGRYRGPESILAYHEAMLSRLRAQPGVEGAALTNALPLSGARASNSFRVAGRAADSLQSTDNAGIRVVAPEYFDVMRMSLVQGRLPGEADRTGGVAVMVINETMSRQTWPGGNALGERLLLDGPGLDDLAFEVIGIVADVRHAGLDEAPAQELYVLLSQLPAPAIGRARAATYVVRSRSDAAALAPGIRAVAESVDRYQPIHGLRTMAQVHSESVASTRFRTALLGVIAVLALALMSVGVYGAISWSVARRTREVGIRIAIGAEPREVVGMIVRQGGMLCVAGVMAGLAISVGMARAMAFLMFGLDPRDPVTFAAVAMLVVVVGLTAAYVPARRAAGVDALMAIRAE